jgi:hypothetical protein
MKRITIVVLLLSIILLANGQHDQIFAQSYDLAFADQLQSQTDRSLGMVLEYRMGEVEGDGDDLNRTYQLAQTFQEYGYNVTYLYRELAGIWISRDRNALYHMWLLVQNPADQQYVAVDPYEGVILTKEVFTANRIDVGQNLTGSSYRYVFIKTRAFITPDEIGSLYYPPDEFYRVHDAYRIEKTGYIINDSGTTQDLKRLSEAVIKVSPMTPINKLFD